MKLDEAIKHTEEVATDKTNLANTLWNSKEAARCNECAEEYRQLAEWLKELKVLKSKKGEWLRMSDLSEEEDDRYKCSHCGNVVHYIGKLNLYTFNSWCGRCGSDNRRKIEVNNERL